eukprot:gene198-biopygen1845
MIRVSWFDILSFDGFPRPLPRSGGGSSTDPHGLLAYHACDEVDHCDVEFIFHRLIGVPGARQRAPLFDVARAADYTAAGFAALFPAPQQQRDASQLLGTPLSVRTSNPNPGETKQQALNRPESEGSGARTSEERKREKMAQRK